MDGTVKYEYHYNRVDLSTFTDAVMGGILVVERDTDGDYHVQYANEGMYRLFGAKRRCTAEQKLCELERYIYPEDLVRIRELFEEAAKKPQPFHVEFRTRTSMQCYKWFDANVAVRQYGERRIYYIHCLDITERIQCRQAVAAVGIWQAALEETKRKYEDLLDQLNRDQNALCCYHLNLTRNSCRCGNSQCSREHERFENSTVESFFAWLYACIKPELQETFQSTFSRQALLRSYAEGDKCVRLEHVYHVSPFRTVWVETKVSMAENPQTKDIEAVLCVTDIQNEKMQRLAMQTIINRRYAFMVILEAQTGSYTVYFRGNKEGQPYVSGMDYDRDCPRYIAHFVQEENAGCLAQEISREALLKTLPESDSEKTMMVRTKALGDTDAVLQFSFSYMDYENRIILFTATDISEAVKKDREQNDALKKALDEARQATIANSSFLSKMNHDMRTPLNGIIGMTELTLKKQDMPEAVRQSLTDIHSSGKFLLNLINTSLDMYKMEHNKMVLHKQVCDYNVVIRNILATVQPMAVCKKIQVGVRYKNTPVRAVIMDELRIQQIFMNLLSNAVKFTPEGGKVELIIQCLSYEKGVAHTKITVRDNGIGMSENFLPKLFTPFEQENNAYTSKNIGTGLGMPIVKQLVEAMGGRISAESRKGLGTTIDVYLDFEYVSEPQVHQEPVRTDESVLQNKRVLLCEDYPLNVKVAVCMLKDKGMLVDCAENGVRAVEKFQASDCGYYDLILMDVRMPVMDGLQAADAIRCMDRPDAKNLPIIAMTANTHTSDIRKCKEVGMNDYIAKPLDLKNLYQVLVRNLRQPLLQEMNA